MIGHVPELIKIASERERERIIALLEDAGEYAASALIIGDAIIGGKLDSENVMKGGTNE